MSDSVREKVVSILSKYTDQIIDPTNLTLRITHELDIYPKSFPTVIGDLEKSFDIEFDFKDYNLKNFITVRSVIELIHKKQLHNCWEEVPS